MGYGNCECVGCYLLGFGNNGDCEMRDVCAVCVESFYDRGAHSRAGRVASECTMNPGYGDCYKCSQDRIFTYNLGLCDEHSCPAEEELARLAQFGNIDSFGVLTKTVMDDALLDAINNDWHNAVLTLLREGASPIAKDEDGLTALALARIKNNIEIVAALSEAAQLLLADKRDL